MRLLLDEMHSPVAAVERRHEGHDVIAVSARVDLRGAPDHELLRAATAEGRAVVTENVRDFVALATGWAAEGREHHGIVLTHPRRFGRNRVAYPGDLIDALGRFLGDPPITGSSWTWWL